MTAFIYFFFLFTVSVARILMSQQICHLLHSFLFCVFLLTYELVSLFGCLKIFVNVIKTLVPLFLYLKIISQITKIRLNNSPLLLFSYL